MQGSFEEMDGPCILVIGAVVLFAERVGDETALEGGASARLAAAEVDPVPNGA